MKESMVAVKMVLGNPDGKCCHGCNDWEERPFTLKIETAYDDIFLCPSCVALLNQGIGKASQV